MGQDNTVSFPFATHPEELTSIQKVNSSLCLKITSHSGTVGDLNFPGRLPVAISQELLDILVCPLCKEPVKLSSNSQGLKCGKCRRVYPIKDDIPVMLVDEAKVETE